MNLDHFLPVSIDWNALPNEKVNGASGFATIKSCSFGAVKIRLIEYSQNYTADHWCSKGHIVYLIKGALSIEHDDLSIHVLSSGMTYIIGDNTLPHKATSEHGARALIID